jgi:NADH-quinone oxidoreductase subunit L
VFVSFDKFLIYSNQANKAALKAIIVNRVADVFFILGIIMLFVIFKTTDYLVIFHLTIYMGYLDSILVFFGARGLEVITLLLLIGGVAKSAQIGLHV